MNKRLINSILFSFCLTTPFLSHSQFQIGLNANVLFPVSGLLVDNYKSGLGGGVTAKYLVDNSFAIGAFANYNFMALRGGPVLGNTNGLYNFGGLLEYYFVQEVSSPYLGIDVGLYTLSNTNTYLGTNGGGNGSTTANSSSFGIAPNIGYKLRLSDMTALNMNLKYNYIFSAFNYNGAVSYVQVTGGIIFNMSK